MKFNTMFCLFTVSLLGFLVFTPVSYPAEPQTLPEILERVKSDLLFDSTFEKYGFSSAEEVQRATYVTPVPVYTLAQTVREMAPARIRGLSTIDEYVVPSTGVGEDLLLPIYADKRMVCLASLSQAPGGKYIVVGFGNTSLAECLNHLNEKFIEAMFSERKMTVKATRLLFSHPFFGPVYVMVETEKGGEYFVNMDGEIMGLSAFLTEFAEQPEMPGGALRSEPEIEGEVRVGDPFEPEKGEEKAKILPAGKMVTGYQQQIQSNWCWDAVTRGNVYHYGKVYTQCQLADYAFSCAGYCYPNGSSCVCSTANFWLNTTCCNQPANVIKVSSVTWGLCGVNHSIGYTKVSKAQIVQSIDNQSPLLVGLMSGGSVGHFWGIYGYSGGGDTLSAYNPWNCLATSGNETKYYTAWIQNAYAGIGWIRNYGIEIGPFTARVKSGKVKLLWETNKESLLAGWNIYKSDDPISGYRKVNEKMIPAHNLPSRYSYSDTSQPEGSLFYRLEYVDLKGKTTVVRWLAL